MTFTPTPRLLQILLEHCAQFRAARLAVLASWTPDCGCTDIGEYPKCETCPHRTVFRDKVRAKILELHEEERHGRQTEEEASC